VKKDDPLKKPFWSKVWGVLQSKTFDEMDFEFLSWKKQAHLYT